MNASKTFSSIVTDYLTKVTGPSNRKLMLLVLFVVACASPTFAQGSSDYNKLEVYGGYSFGRFKSNTETSSFTDPSGSKTTFSDLCSRETGEQVGLNFQNYFCKRRRFNGFDASVTYNLSRYVGVKFNVTGHFKKEQFVDVFPTPGGPVTFTLTTRERLYNFMGGLQVKDNSKEARVKPFGHILVGAARYRSRIRQSVDVFPEFDFFVED